MHILKTNTNCSIFAIFLTVPVFQIDPNRGGDQPNCETHTMQDLSVLVMTVKRISVSGARNRPRNARDVAVSPL